MLGYQFVGDYPGAVLVPDPPRRQPKVGHWRTNPNRPQIMRGVRRTDNSENPLALGSKVFDSVGNVDRRESDGPNAGKKRGLINCIAMAVETGAVSLDDLDEKTRRRVERAMA